MLRANLGFPMSTWQELRDNPRLKKIYEDRSAIIRAVREFFWQKGFLETDTPVAVKFPGQEPHLNPIPLAIHGPDGQGGQFHLITSPEFSLKKLLAAGFEKIFSITKCFRDFESFGGAHNAEFTMIEWYRAPGTCRDFMDDAEALFKHAAKAVGAETMKYGNSEVPVNQPWERAAMKDVWRECVGVNLDDYLKIEELKGLVSGRGLAVSAGDAYDDLFFKIFLNEIEPHLGQKRPLFVYDYPAQMASLSRLCEHDSRYAERAECYIGGLELCNGFGELLDPDEQKKRLEADKALRARLGKPVWPVDSEFIAALPAIAARAANAAGVALGVDRMVLLLTGAKDINEVIFQSINDQLSLSDLSHNKY